MDTNVTLSCIMILLISCYSCIVVSDISYNSTSLIGDQYEIPEQCRMGNGSVLSVVCRCNNTEVKDILYMLPLNIQRLRFDLDSDLHGHYPVPSIDLRNIAHLNEITYLQLIGAYPESGNTLIFDENTFENMTKLRELHINIVTYSTYFGEMAKYMRCLEVLDLSGTTKLNIDVIDTMMGYLNKTCLNQLMLSSFQMPGRSQFSDSINISSFFSTAEPLPLEHLDLSSNMLGVIYPSIITMLPKLKTLDISHNNLLAWTNDALVIESLFHPTLEILNMENQGAGYRANWDINTIKTKSVRPKTEYISQGKFELLESIIVCINRKSIGNFSVLFDDSLAFCSTIRCIGQVSSHILKGVPCEAFGSYKDSFDSSCPYFIRFPVFKRLKQFIAGDLNWVLRPSAKMSQKLCVGDTPLMNMSFGQNGNWIQSSFLYDIIEILTFSSEFRDLEEINLEKNNLASIPTGHLPNLRKLDLTGNHVNPDLSVCEMYPNLTYLSLASNNISDFQADFVGECKFLEHLDLSQNSMNLTQSPISIVHNSLLRSLNLNRNKLDTLPGNFTKQLEMISRYQNTNGVKNNLKVTFGENNLLCQCNRETIEFITWFQSTTVEIPDKGSYSCSGFQGEVFLIGIDIKGFQQTCFPSNSKLIAEGVLLTICTIGGILFIAALYRYRWRLQYRLIKISKLFWWCNRNTETVVFDDDIDEVIKYDAFVSYCAEDRFWVHDCLMKNLESDKYGLKLCIHYRDFPLGEDISSVIVKSIRQSRKLLIVLSECSIGRPWCQFEFQVALSEAVRRGTKLAVIKLGQFNVEEMDDNSVAWVLDNHTYLQWRENENAQKVFWFKLLRHLYDDDTGVCCFSGPRGLGSNDITAFAESNAETQTLII